MSDRPVVLIISGIDPANGAGTGRDIITVNDNGCHPVSIPSVLTVQNSISFERSVATDMEYIKDSLESLEKEFIFSSVKTGLLPMDEKWIGAFISLIEKFKIPVVIDPVIKATADMSAGYSLSQNYKMLITGLNKILTPNFSELEMIYRFIYGNSGSRFEMASKLAKDFSCTVVTTFEGLQPYVNIMTSNSSTDIPLTIYKPELKYHGTGCAFSSALASGLAKGLDIENAVRKSAQYVLEKIQRSARFHSNGQNFL